MRFRWRLLVNFKFQIWFLARFMIYTASLLLLLGVSVYLWCKIVADTIFKLVGLISPSTFTLIKMNSDMALRVFVILALSLAGLAALEAVIFSRKIAGPLFAFIRHLKACAGAGRLEKFSLRKDDLFLELTDAFNLVVDAVNAKEVNESLTPVRLQPFGLDSENVNLSTRAKKSRA